MQDEDVDNLPTVVSPEVSRRRRRLGVTLIGLAAYACAIVAMVAGAAYAGFNTGLGERPQPTAPAAALDGSYLISQMQQCSDAVAAGNGERAIPFCEEVLKWQPSNRGAQELLVTARALRPTEVPTSLPATAVVSAPEDKAAALRALQDAATRRDWDAAISLAEQLRAIDRSYERTTVDNALYAALVARGTTRINANDLEAGLFDLELAATIRKLDDRTEGTRQLVSMYQDGLLFYGADWDATISRLRQVYQIAPAYRDTGRLLLQAYQRSGDDAYARLDYCGAERRYSAAMQLFPSAEMDSKRISAQSGCIAITSGAWPSGTIPITPTNVITRGG